MNRFVKCGLALAVLVAPVVAQADDADVMNYRKQIMKTMGEQNAAMQMTLQGKVPADQFVSHGVGICYFEDEVDWRWRVAGLSEFRIPRGTRASEWEIECATVDREYQAHQLYKFIQDPDVAKDLGWNVKMVKEALLRACRESTYQEAGEWEKLEVELKNATFNDKATGDKLFFGEYLVSLKKRYILFFSQSLQRLVSRRHVRKRTLLCLLDPFFSVVISFKTDIFCLFGYLGDNLKDSGVEILAA